ncbi:hypothetical protein [Roseomonas sp. BN140053]|uniref:hypothetical protein n=1 Tax=Roseomonas sp. BN140053 TaxID=3391898 RepID=UPI0039EB9ACE
MAQLAPVAALVGTGLSIYSTVHKAQEQSKVARNQAAQQAEQNVAQAQVAAVQAQAEARARQDTLDRTLASVRARAAASGLQPDQGSAAAVTAGLRRDAAQDTEEDAALRAARLAAGRRSLLNTDGSLTTWLRAGSSFASAARNLLD